MANIIDRRLTEKGKSLPSRNKFIKKISDELKTAVKKSIRDGSIKDLSSDAGKKVVVPAKGPRQPTFHYNYKTGIKNIIVSGNKEYEKGDKIPKEKEDTANKGACDGPDSQDPYQFLLTNKEWLDIYFEDMELPNFIKEALTKIEHEKPERAGFAKDGAPNRLNVVQTLKVSKGRHFALEMPLRRKIKEIEKSLKLDPENQELLQELSLLKKKLKKIPFISETDLRYNHWEIHPKPVTHAVIFYLMDVSASVSERQKELAKRHFLLELLFLLRKYEHIEIRFVTHTSDAMEVTEDEFFHGTRSGGTVISSGYKLIYKIIQENYDPVQYNIYISQMTDGENFLSDDELTLNLLKDKLLPITQYFTYIEVKPKEEPTQSGEHTIIKKFREVEKSYQNFKAAIITHEKDIYPVFKKLFEKKQ